ncbi:hypothetical protein A0J61_09961 [Choanephora cucurbitarum]|uniref:Uncharacterized protein n=1 Tax=Choanephora cucurbitarum TaxID=101091 RepID=A0A1C7MYS1_9FUNG|nr:hypothetical protein A0J61_09961 [Choanephora cucurbitarum]
MSIEDRVDHLVHDSTPAYYTRRWVKRISTYPDHLRVKGSVLPAILPLVILTGVYAYFIGVMYITWGWNIALSNSIVPVLSVVLGLLLAFRANTSYARYYEGRQLWQDLSSNTRNLARLVWCSIPERTQNDHLEKMRCMKLLLAFAVATKHYLRRELGIDYYDLDYLLPPNWIPAAADDRLFIIQDESSDEEGVVVTSVKRDGSQGQGMLNVNEGGGDHIDDLDNQQLASGPASSAVSTVDNSGTSTIQDEDRPRHQKKKKKRFVSDEDLPDEGNSDMSLPLEIIFRLSLYMEQAKSSGKIDGQFSNVIITHLNNLNDCLSGMERIVNTPIPAVYVVHLKQSVVLYILATPFTLIDQLGWWIVPTLVLAAFILFGIDAIGAQIDNPFGYNSNDFPLNTFCDALRKEIEFIVYHLPCETENAMLI